MIMSPAQLDQARQGLRERARCASARSSSSSASSATTSPSSGRDRLLRRRARLPRQDHLQADRRRDGPDGQPALGRPPARRPGRDDRRGGTPGRPEVRVPQGDVERLHVRSRSTSRTRTASPARRARSPAHSPIPSSARRSTWRSIASRSTRSSTAACSRSAAARSHRPTRTTTGSRARPADVEAAKKLVAESGLTTPIADRAPDRQLAGQRAPRRAHPVAGRRSRLRPQGRPAREHRGLREPDRRQVRDPAHPLVGPGRSRRQHLPVPAFDGLATTPPRRPTRRSTPCSTRPVRRATSRPARRSTSRSSRQVRARRNVITFQIQNLYAAHTAALHGFAMYVDGMPRLKSAYLGGG